MAQCYEIDYEMCLLFQLPDFDQAETWKRNLSQ